jgi:arylformamidase
LAAFEAAPAEIFYQSKRLPSMKTYDITVAIHPGLAVWEGDPPVRFEKAASIQRGDIANVTELALSAHTGTHVDAPLHFIEGRQGVDRINLDVLIGPALVVEFQVEKEITAADLESAALPAGSTRLLCKSRCSSYWGERSGEFVSDFVGISADGAAWLVEHGIRLVGVDYLGIERMESLDNGAPVHRILLEAGVVVVEGLDLSEVQPGPYHLICLPMKIQEGDGAPCRAVLQREE